MHDHSSQPHGESAPTGQAVKELRARLGLTQEAFAHAIAVTVSTVNRWENGHATPSRLAWRAIQELVNRHEARQHFPATMPPAQGL